jgi:hypothetical protein
VAVRGEFNREIARGAWVWVNCLCTPQRFKASRGGKL